MSVPKISITGKWNGTRDKSGGIYEPDYLDLLKPEFPQYESLNFQIKGYDYTILESYQKFLHRVAEYMELDVSECYALPPKHALVQRLKPNSTVIDSEYKVTTFERNLQINDLDAHMYPQFLRIVQAALPEGVTLRVEEHNEDHEELRFVPDKTLIDLKSQLELMQKDQVPSKKK